MNAAEFTLPSEVPASIEARSLYHGYETVLTLWTDGVNRFWRAEYDMEDWTEVGALECFTDHRIISPTEETA